MRLGRIYHLREDLPIAAAETAARYAGSLPCSGNVSLSIADRPPSLIAEVASWYLLVAGYPHGNEREAFESHGRYNSSYGAC